MVYTLKVNIKQLSSEVIEALKNNEIIFLPALILTFNSRRGYHEYSSKSLMISIEPKCLLNVHHECQAQCMAKKAVTNQLQELAV